MTIITGTSTDGAAGTFIAQGGNGVGTNRAGGAAFLIGGNSTGNVQGGQATLQGGNGGSTGTGGYCVINAGAGGDTSGNGGWVTINAGTPQASGAGGYILLIAGNALGSNQDGGNIILQPGTRTGSGTHGSVILDGRIQGKKGADVASAQNIAVGAGNFFEITGTTQIDGMSVTGWQAGSEVTLMFTASLTVTHNSGSGIQPFQLAGGASFSATAGDTLTVIYDGSYWREKVPCSNLIHVKTENSVFLLFM